MPIATAAGQLHPNGIDISVDDGAGGFPWAPVRQTVTTPPEAVEGQATYPIARVGADPLISTLSASALESLVRATYPGITLREKDNINVIVDGTTEQFYKVNSSLVAVAGPTQTGGSPTAPVPGVMVTPFAETYGALPNTRVGGSPLLNGDLTRLLKDSGGNPRGTYVRESNLWTFRDDSTDPDFLTIATKSAMLTDAATEERLAGFDYFVTENQLNYRVPTNLGAPVPVDLRSRVSDDAGFAALANVETNQICFHVGRQIEYFWTGTFWHERASSPPGSAATAHLETVATARGEWTAYGMGASNAAPFVWEAPIGATVSPDSYIEVADNAALAADNSANNRQDGFVWKVLTSRVLYMRGEGGAVPIETLVNSGSDADMVAITEQVAGQRVYRSDLNVFYTWRPEGFWAMAEKSPPTSAATTHGQVVTTASGDWTAHGIGASNTAPFVWDAPSGGVAGVANNELTMASASHGLTSGDLHKTFHLDENDIPQIANTTGDGSLLPVMTLIEIVDANSLKFRVEGSVINFDLSWDITNGGAPGITNSRYAYLQDDGTVGHASAPNIAKVVWYYVDATRSILLTRNPIVPSLASSRTSVTFDQDTNSGQYTMTGHERNIVYRDPLTATPTGPGVLTLPAIAFQNIDWLDGIQVANVSTDLLTIAAAPGTTINGGATPVNVTAGTVVYVQRDPDPNSPTNVIVVT